MGGISLPAPRTGIGKPLMQALRERRTTREFTNAPISDQVLSDLLWAGFGINRPENDHRTAPSAMNSQEVDIYVARRDGLFMYEAKSHRLNRLLRGDFREKVSGQPFMKEAAVALIYVADLPRLTKAKPESRSFYAAIDAGCIVQNVYLFCASENLGTVVFDLDRKVLGEAIQLKPNQQIILAQAVGYPRDKAVTLK